MEVARAVFAEHGYEGATTREIARRADVSETLVFRYFGTKAALFDRILFAPVGGLMNSFLFTHGPDRVGTGSIASTRDFLVALFVFADENRTLLGSFAARRMSDGSDNAPSTPAGLSTFFDLAAAEVDRIHLARGTIPEVTPGIAVRLSLGMVIASILFDTWLFPEGPPDRDELIESLACMLVMATTGQMVSPDR